MNNVTKVTFEGENGVTAEWHPGDSNAWVQHTPTDHFPVYLGPAANHGLSAVAEQLEPHLVGHQTEVRVILTGTVVINSADENEAEDLVRGDVEKWARDMEQSACSMLAEVRDVHIDVQADH